MLERENNTQCCDIDPVWESECILYFLPKDRLKNKKEIAYLTRYQHILSMYYNTRSESESEIYEKELSKLENTETIKEIVAREGPKDLILEMTFAKTTLDRNEENKKEHSKIKDVLMCIASIFILLSIGIFSFVIGIRLGSPVLVSNLFYLGILIFLVAFNVAGYFLWCKYTRIATKADFWFWILSQLVAITLIILICKI